MVIDRLECVAGVVRSVFGGRVWGRLSDGVKLRDRGRAIAWGRHCSAFLGWPLMMDKE